MPIDEPVVQAMITCVTQQADAARSAATHFAALQAETIAKQAARIAELEAKVKPKKAEAAK